MTIAALFKNELVTCSTNPDLVVTKWKICHSFLHPDQTTLLTAAATAAATTTPS